MNQEAGWKQKVDLFRKRFGAREDVFGVKHKYQVTDNSDPGNPQLVEVSQYHPQCMNHGNQNICLISQGKGGCTLCDHKKYQPLTDEWIWKHIDGQKELILYLLQKDGIKFGACDFDRGECFEDAKAVRDYSLKLGLPCYIARSTKKGYHLYWFFTQPVPAHHFTSLVDHIYKEVGFMDRFMENPSNPPPEVFPKQVNFNPDGIGNGIKVPMIERRFAEGFNCWVNDESVPISPEIQWEYFRDCKEITPEQLLKSIEDNGITIIQAPVGRKRTTTPTGPNGETLPQEPIKPKGDFWRVINNCPALKQFWERDANGVYRVPNDAPGDHFHRTASIAMAVSTTNGVEAVRSRWGDVVEKEIQYAIDTNQHPWSCKAMQDQGICRIGVHPVKNDHCIKKVPPGEYINGQYRVNPDGLPESEWKEPSPIRFATGFMTREQLLKTLEELHAFQNQKDANGKTALPPSSFDEDLRNCIRVSYKHEPDVQKEVRDYIESRKAVKSSDLKKMFQQVNKEVKERELENKKEQYPHFTFKNVTYFLRPGGYFVSRRTAQGVPETYAITNFTVDILEEIMVVKPQDLADTDDNLSVSCRHVKCAVNYGIDKGKPNRKYFKVPLTEWIRTQDSFFSIIMGAAGTNLMYETADFNALRNCIFEFSKDTKVIRKKVEEFGHYKLNGEFAYVTPSVLVTKDKIQPNNEFELQFNDLTCKHLDFKIIDESKFKDLALHILSDYFECNSSTATMAIFAHALGASILSHLPITKSPVLWIDGSLGQGKSFIAEVAQCFYGNFTNVTASDSTTVGKIAIAHNFRDAFLVMDDFKKSLSDHDLKGTIKLIQKAYDRNGRIAAQRDGEAREPKMIRCLIGITGEDPPFEEASAISRLILVSTNKDSMNKDKGERANLRRSEYCGFTPYFIQYAYGLGVDEVKRIFNEYLEHFEKKSRESENKESMLRVSQNMAFNMTPFRLAMDMLVERGVVPVQKRDELCARHLKNLDICRETVIAQTTSHRGSAMFLNSIKELLQDPARYHITHLPGFDPTEYKNSKPLGFWRSNDPTVIFLYHGVALGEVGNHLKKQSSWAQSQQHVARQLQEEGHIAMYDPSSPSFTKYVKTPNGGPRNYCWAIRMESLGFSPDPKPAKKEVNPLPDNVVNIAASE